MVAAGGHLVVGMGVKWNGGGGDAGCVIMRRV